MPSYTNNKAYFIEDLTSYIKTEKVTDIDDETREILVASVERDSHEYGIEIVVEDIKEHD